jgi:hypothetical protein
MFVGASQNPKKPGNSKSWLGIGPGLVGPGYIVG